MTTYRIYYDPEGMQELCALSPFNLKNDLKNISEEELNSILEELANELQKNGAPPPAIVPLYWGIGRKAGYGKIRVVDVGRSAGKSNGYRCIALFDIDNKFVFLLHVYRHGHGEDKNISQKDKNKLRNLVDQYIESMNSGKS